MAAGGGMIHTELEFAVNPRCSAKTIYVGMEREPVLIVDDLLADPVAILRNAETGAAFRKDDKDFYPGIRKTLSTAYASSMYRHLHNVLLDTFSDAPDATIHPMSCLLSLTTTRPEHLRPIQSVPHFDNYDKAHIAGVHYLCAASFGGTSFYRHRSTAYETMTAQRLAQYAPRLKQEVMDLNARSFTYIRGDTALFECTASVEAKFNRAIFYRSNILHSGDIRTSSGMSADPRTGRLTANTLGLIRPCD